MARGIPGRRHMADAGEVKPLKYIAKDVLEGQRMSTALAGGKLRDQDTAKSTQANII